MIKATLDANVLVSGFVAPQGVPGEILGHWGNITFELIISEHIIASAERAWQKPYFLARFTADEVAQSVARLRADGVIVAPATTVVGVAADEEDDLVLATAVAGEAAYVVTGDHGFLRVDIYRGISIISPREFLSLLERRQTEAT